MTSTYSASTTIPPLSRHLYSISETNLYKIISNPHHRIPKQIKNNNNNITYQLPSPTSLPLTLPHNFIELKQDICTTEFLINAKLRQSSTKDALGSVLQGFGYSLTDANAMVDRGKMFLLGKSHFDILLQHNHNNTDKNSNNNLLLLLDVGAGDGNITSQISSRFHTTVAVETSIPMGKRLQERGYITSTDPEIIFDPTRIGSQCYDLVMLLNVLDRADKPISLLKGLKALIKPQTGRLLLGVVLPWCPFVESGKKQKIPSEQLPMEGGLCKEGATFERSVTILCRDVLIPLGFEIERWTRLPYISEGDSHQDIYILDDAVFVLKVAENSSSNNSNNNVPLIQEPNLQRIKEENVTRLSSSSVWSYLFEG
jgi:SAM-dependent methyltransferase